MKTQRRRARRRRPRRSAACYVQPDRTPSGSNVARTSAQAVSMPPNDSGCAVCQNSSSACTSTASAPPRIPIRAIAAAAPRQHAERADHRREARNLEDANAPLARAEERARHRVDDEDAGRLEVPRVAVRHLAAKHRVGHGGVDALGPARSGTSGSARRGTRSYRATPS